MSEKRSNDDILPCRFQALSIESDSDDDLEDAGGNNLRNDGTLLASDPPKPL